jgi:hypothetical protein
LMTTGSVPISVCGKDRPSFMCWVPWKAVGRDGG